MRRLVIATLALGALGVAALLLIPSTPVSAHFVPAPCDFITGGGFIFRDDGERANFGSHGGCKKNGPDAPFWGHVNYVDHGGFNGSTPYHVNSTQITGYLIDPAFPNARDICGFARTNTGETVRFRVRNGGQRRARGQRQVRDPGFPTATSCWRVRWAGTGPAAATSSSTSPTRPRRRLIRPRASLRCAGI